MTAIAQGTLVKHVSLGVGKVVAVEPTALHVFFPETKTRFAAKLRLPAASTLLTRDGVEPNAWLQGLTSFSLDARSGRYALATNFLSHGEAIAEFLQIYPQGFVDPAYGGDGVGKRERASRWRAAHQEWAKTLGQGEGERLLADDDVPELARRALRVAAHVGSMPGVVDLDAMAEALEPGDVVKGYFEALFALISANPATRARVERVFAMSEALGVARDMAWPMASLFPFLADPATFVVVVPKLAVSSAARLGCDVKFDASPNWATYAAIRGLSAQLLEKLLRPNGARDFIDVETFLHAIGTRRAAAVTERAAANDGASADEGAPGKKRSTTKVRARRDQGASPAPQRKR